jgi:hypothetical protein
MQASGFRSGGGDPIAPPFTGDVDYTNTRGFIFTNLRDGTVNTEVGLYNLAIGLDIKTIVGAGFFGLAFFLLGLILVCVGVMLQFFKEQSGWIALWVVGLLLVAIGIVIMGAYAWKPVINPQPKF